MRWPCTACSFRKPISLDGPEGRRARYVTFDLHGNEDEAFLEQADMAFAVKYYPTMTVICRAKALTAHLCGRSAVITSRAQDYQDA